MKTSSVGCGEQQQQQPDLDILGLLFEQKEPEEPEPRFSVISDSAATRTAARQASLSVTTSRSYLLT